MNLPLFYIEQVNVEDPLFTFPEESSKHIIQVLRMKMGERLRITDGNGYRAEAEIVSDHRKHCQVKRLSIEYVQPASHQKCIAISPVKNSSRFEWFLEKATEIGVAEIVPLICSRTEKQQLRTARLQQVLQSAMLQSQQAWMPRLCEPASFIDLVKRPYKGSRYIAHCEATQERNLLPVSTDIPKSLILIGPEGDFTEEEIALALHEGFTPVSLGESRLRTETAGIVAATLLFPALG
jgi:16S rRNA (uracil1498-N3)-methyltransferase